MVAFTVNETRVEVEADPAKPLLWVLREDLGIMGPKYGCGIAECGACRVLIDGVSTPSCLVSIGSLEGARVTTVEGLASDDGTLSLVQQAWIAEQVPQCGFCQPGFLIAVTDLLASNPDPTDAEINDAISNICRCGTYIGVFEAALAAAKSMKGA